MNPRHSRESLETRIREQFPALFITLVSVLIGLVLADLVSQARARMVLSPLTLGTLLTWCQLSANGFSALVAWIIYAHIGISRRRIPSLADSIIAFVLPFALLLGNSFVGAEPAWQWFYFASTFLLLSLLTTLWLLYLMGSEAELASFRHVLRPMGFMSAFYLGFPFYAVVGWADQHRLLSPPFEVLCAATAAPSALVSCHLFLRDWRRAVTGTRHPS